MAVDYLNYIFREGFKFTNCVKGEFVIRAEEISFSRWNECRQKKKRKKNHTEVACGWPENKIHVFAIYIRGINNKWLRMNDRCLIIQRPHIIVCPIAYEHILWARWHMMLWIFARIRKNDGECAHFTYARLFRLVIVPYVDLPTKSGIFSNRMKCNSRCMQLKPYAIIIE